VPFVGSIYKGVKQVSDTLLSGNGNSFRKVLLVRYPHPQAWSLAFQTSVPGEVAGGSMRNMLRFSFHHAESGKRVLFLRAQADTIELDMTVDVALRSIVSMGVVADSEAGKNRVMHHNH